MKSLLGAPPTLAVTAKGRLLLAKRNGGARALVDVGRIVVTGQWGYINTSMDGKKIKCRLTALRILALVGVALSIFALYEHVTILAGGHATAFCSISSTINCESAIRSSWSSFWGVPLGSYGLLFYLVVFALGLAVEEHSFSMLPAIGSVLYLFAFAASLGSILLFLVLKFAVGAYCPVCLAIYLVNFLLLATSWKLGGQSSWWRGLWAGLKSLIRFFALLLGLKTALSSMQVIAARLAFLALIFAACFCFILPEYWSLRLVHQREGKLSGGIARIEDLNALRDWKRAKPVEITPPILEGVLADHVRGPEQAPIQMLEFSDFECPACRAMWVVLERLMAEYRDKVRLIFRNYPLDNVCNSQIKVTLHKNSCFAAEFARCAGEQGRFWDVVEYLATFPVFDHKEGQARVRDRILQGSDYWNLDKEAIAECLASRRHLAKIKMDVLQAEKLGVDATPAIWINGKPLKILSEGALRLIFEEILKK